MELKKYLMTLESGIGGQKLGILPEGLSIADSIRKVVILVSIHVLGILMKKRFHYSLEQIFVLSLLV